MSASTPRTPKRQPDRIAIRRAETLVVIQEALRAGQSQRMAFLRAGLGETTFFRWMKAGDEWVNKGPEAPKADERCAEFYLGVEAAKIDAKARWIKVIERLGTGESAEYDDDGNVVKGETRGDWRAIQFLLKAHDKAGDFRDLDDKARDIAAEMKDPLGGIANMQRQLGEAADAKDKRIAVLEALLEARDCE